MLRALLLGLSTRRRIGEVMDRFAVTRRFVRRFVAGTTAEEALGVLGGLNGAGLLGAVTYLGENVREAPAAAQATLAYLDLLDEIKRRNLKAVPSLKLTHLGLDLGEAVCLANLRRVLERGRETETLVWIDMESSAYTDRTLDLYARVRPEFPNAACVLQAYLRRTRDDLERLIALGARIRLCKGAYREPPALAYPDKRDVDGNYVRLVERVLAPDAQARGVYVGFATHDERLIGIIGDRAAARGVPADRFEHQMLYGIRHDLHPRLRGRGLRLRVLVPFGDDWYGYFMRRLAERPANLLFLLRNLHRG
ncbi:MAG: proline dehydrogenase family protein [Candidatus Rokubacteria bacterium]|nr:proline dehydrogenase family protein [Candidatus Rokubacteria bacterium]